MNKTEGKYEYVIRVDDGGKSFVISEVVDRKGHVVIELFGQFYFKEENNTTVLECKFRVLINHKGLDNMFGTAETKLSDTELAVYSKKELVNKMVNTDRELDCILDEAVEKVNAVTNNCILQ